MGGYVPLGYDLDKGSLVINQKEADSVRKIFSLYIETKNVTILHDRLKSCGIRSKIWTSIPDRQFGGAVLSRGNDLPSAQQPDLFRQDHPQRRAPQRPA
jgi:site-specific DNA recombinase